MPFGHQLLGVDGLAPHQPGQADLPVLELGFWVVGPLHIGPQETREIDDPPVGSELGVLAPRAVGSQAHLHTEALGV